MAIFSFVIVNYNTQESLRRCLTSILKFTQLEKREIIVIDNNSQDASQAMIKEFYFKDVSYIFNSSNLGFSSACNQGALVAKGDYLFFLNSDAYLVSDILLEIEKIFSDNSKIAAIFPVLKDSKLDLETRFFGRFPSFKNTIFKKSEKKLRLETKKLIKNNDILKVDWISGASMVVKNTAFFSVGGFDKTFFMYFEDIDFCQKLKKLNYECVITPDDIFLIHERGLSFKGDNKLKKKYYYQSQNYYFKKHYGSIGMYLLKFFRFLYLVLFK